MSRLSRRSRRIAFGAAILIGWAGSGLLVWQASYAAFSATTVNNGNSWTAGTVALADDDSAATLFTATGLGGGATGTKCIKVDYTGTLASTVKVYATGALTGTGLGTYIDLTIEEGTGGTFASCTGFSSGGTIYSGTLAAFVSAPHTNFGNGVGTWAPSGTASKVYRFVYTVQSNNAAQGLNVTAGFTWEAQNT
jgi:hypothetical protein